VVDLDRGENEARSACVVAGRTLSAVEDQLKIAERYLNELQKIIIDNCGDIPCIEENGRNRNGENHKSGSSPHSG